MSENGIAKSSIIIIVVVAIIAICACSFLVLNQEEPVEYFTVEAPRKSSNALIEEYRIIKKLVRESSITDEMQSSLDFTKYGILDRFNEEYFENKKVAVVVLYEDTTKDYTYSIDKVEYNEARTEATIHYTNKIGGYAGPMNGAWYNYMFVELDKTVENVNFVKAQTSTVEQ